MMPTPPPLPHATDHQTVLADNEALWNYIVRAKNEELQRLGHSDGPINKQFEAVKKVSSELGRKVREQHGAALELQYRTRTILELDLPPNPDSNAEAPTLAVAAPDADLELDPAETSESTAPGSTAPGADPADAPHPPSFDPLAELTRQQELANTKAFEEMLRVTAPEPSPDALSDLDDLDLPQPLPQAALGAALGQDTAPEVTEVEVTEVEVTEHPEAEHPLDIPATPEQEPAQDEAVEAVEDAAQPSEDTPEAAPETTEPTNTENAASATAGADQAEDAEAAPSKPEAGVLDAETLAGAGLSALLDALSKQLGTGDTASIQLTKTGRRRFLLNIEADTRQFKPVAYSGTLSRIQTLLLTETEWDFAPTELK